MAQTSGVLASPPSTTLARKDVGRGPHCWGRRLDGLRLSARDPRGTGEIVTRESSRDRGGGLATNQGRYNSPPGGRGGLTVRGIFSGVNRDSLLDSVRTALAAVAAMWIARLLKMPEYYWAPISAIVII